MRLAVPAVFALMLAQSGWFAPAAASDLGCTAQLCLSNPGGPMQNAACIQPIEKLWSDLVQGRPFPTCSEDGVAFARIKGKRDGAHDRVIMTDIDGSRQTYSLACASALPSAIAIAPEEKAQP